MKINIDDIIESFVIFYGEDRREEITTKLKNTLILNIQNFSSLKNSNIESKYYQILKKEFSSLLPDSNLDTIKSFLGESVNN